MSMRTLRTFVVAAWVVALAACAKDAPKVIPNQIQGRWVTQAAGYENRYLQLEKDFVLIGVGRDVTPSIQRVYRVESEGNGRQATYRIYSTGYETDDVLTLYFDPANGGEIRLKNQGGLVWKRVPVPE